MSEILSGSMSTVADTSELQRSAFSAAFVHSVAETVKHGPR